ncbi:hypothetical protein C2S52_018340 [Perilla frutescens var. hirtella]|nr:hypothetical protein C2S52_018340 [Perilla frutescens var. hirtella]KAH6812056.1 hypothetical protein C2S51_025818 [Perilla frutescens var. frutescens]
MIIGIRKWPISRVIEIELSMCCQQSPASCVDAAGDKKKPRVEPSKGCQQSSASCVDAAGDKKKPQFRLKASMEH